MKPILIIMAAGIGSRYGGIKQLDKFTKQGEMIMDFSLYDAYEAGFRKVCFIIKEEFRDVFKSQIEKGAGQKYEVHYVFQEIDDLPDGYSVPEGRTKPWGTGHAVLAARNIIDAPFAVINADDYYGKEGFNRIYDFLTTKVDDSHSCMVGFEIEKTLSENGTVSRGICKVKDGKLTEIVEHLKVSRNPETGLIADTLPDGSSVIISADSPVSMNLWGFAPDYINILKEDFIIALDKIMTDNPLRGEYYVQTPLNSHIADGSLSCEVLSSADQWFGVTYKEDVPDVIEKFAALKMSGEYPMKLWG